MQSVLSTVGPVLHNFSPKPINSPLSVEEKRRESRDTYAEAYDSSVTGRNGLVINAEASTA